MPPGVAKGDFSRRETKTRHFVPSQELPCKPQLKGDAGVHCNGNTCILHPKDPPQNSSTTQHAVK